MQHHIQSLTVLEYVGRGSTQEQNFGSQTPNTMDLQVILARE